MIEELPVLRCLLLKMLCTLQHHILFAANNGDVQTLLIVKQIRRRVWEHLRGLMAAIVQASCRLALVCTSIVQAVDEPSTLRGRALRQYSTVGTAWMKNVAHKGVLVVVLPSVFRAAARMRPHMHPPAHPQTVQVVSQCPVLCKLDVVCLPECRCVEEAINRYGAAVHAESCFLSSARLFTVHDAPATRMSS